MKKLYCVLVCVVCLLAWSSAFAKDKKDAGELRSKQSGKKQATKKDQENKEELKLEDMLPEKRPFGPSASSPAFSFDSKYGAYLYRPYKERRHGSDLHIYNVEKDVVIRITWPSVMSKFQESARKVVEDRIEKAKKSKDKSKDKNGEDEDESDPDESGEKDGEEDKDAEKRDDKGEDKSKKDKDENEDGEKEDKDVEEEKEEEELKDRGDWVDDKDAEAEKSPKYAGISQFQWSPVANEILLESENDVYRYEVSSEKLTRLTHTRGREYWAEWLEDGNGYTYWRDGAVFRKVFGCEVERQMDPKLPNGDSLSAHSLSPDGKRAAIVSSKTIKEGEASKVEIAKYRDRFMKSQEVSRHVLGDPLSVSEYRIYVQELSVANDEKDKLTEVFRFEKRTPADRLSRLTWSPDSNKIAFLTFEQDPALVKMYEVEIGEAAADEGPKDVEAEEDKDREEDNEDESEDADSDETGPNGVDKAKEVYRFLHHGGPMTPRMMKLWYLADNKRIVYLSEQTGFRHLHVLDPLYETFRSLTSGSYEVYPIDISKDRKWMFVQATKEHPSRTDIYRVSTSSGKMVRLTKESGVHIDPAVSEDGTKLLVNLISFKQLKELRFIDIAAKKQKILTDSHPEEAHEFAKHCPEFFDYENRHGHKLYGMMFKPDNWSKKDKRPVLIYFYGGPLGTRKMVYDGSYGSDNYGFPYYMAKKHGYLTCTIDTRGNSGYAGVFEKANFGQVGRPQVEDLVDGVKVLVAKYGVDPNKVAIHGWSFGGFQTQMCMYAEPDVFRAGIAGAGPTEWENYSLFYTRHAIIKSESDEATLKESSLLPLAKNLKGYLLLVHGMEDSNVLYQDTVRVYRELLKAGKETLVELFIDPTGGHHLGGDVKTLSRYRKYEQFLLRTTGRGEKNVKGERKKSGNKKK